MHWRLSRLVEKLYDIACGKDIKMFILVRHQSAHPISYPKPTQTCSSDRYDLPLLFVNQTVFSLYVASVIADCFSSLTLLYLGSNHLLIDSFFQQEIPSVIFSEKNLMSDDDNAFVACV